MKRTSFLAAGFAAALISGPAIGQEVRGITDDTIRLGTHLDLSGPTANFGVPASNALRMAAEKINENGGINGREIEIIIEDNQYQVPRAVQAVNKLIYRDDIFAMIGALGTSMNNAAMPIQKKEGVPNLFPTGQARSLWEPLSPLNFAATSSYYDQIRSGLKYLVDNEGIDKVCALYQSNDFGEEVFAGIEDQAEASGVEIVATATYKPTDNDFTSQLLQLKSSGCGVLALGSLGRDSILIYTAARQNGLDIPVVGVSASYDPTIAAAPGTDGLYAVIPTVVPSDEDASPEAKAFMEEFASRYGTDINATAINAINALNVTALALENAGRDITLDKFLAALEDVKDYQSYWGTPPMSFSAESHQGTKSSYLYQIQDGDYVEVSDSVEY
ncbi:ABC transporter substrate-binding protein [Martelella sp. FLE1502]